MSEAEKIAALEAQVIIKADIAGTMGTIDYIHKLQVKVEQLRAQVEDLKLAADVFLTECGKKQIIIDQLKAQIDAMKCCKNCGRAICSPGCIKENYRDWHLKEVQHEGR